MSYTPHGSPFSSLTVLQCHVTVTGNWHDNDFFNVFAVYSLFTFASFVAAVTAYVTYYSIWHSACHNCEKYRLSNKMYTTL